MKYENSMRLTPLLKYPGGKGAELSEIAKYMPKRIGKYVEPFVGGGAVYFAIDAYKYYINDISIDLMLLYEYVKNSNADFFSELDVIDRNWRDMGSIVDKTSDFFMKNLYNYKTDVIVGSQLHQIIYDKIESIEIFDLPMFKLDEFEAPLFKEQLTNNMVSIIKRIKRNEIKKGVELDEKEIKNNFECAVKSSYYMYFRQLYNNPFKYKLNAPKRVAIYLFIREYCYSSMFRFNHDGGFNVPYGGISYNKKSLKNKIEYYRTQPLKDKLKNTELSSKDFYDFVKGLELNLNDFMFLDPPYDTNFSEYDKNKFDRDDQLRLANYLQYECCCKFMLVIKKTDYIFDLYKDRGFSIIEFNKKYSVSFKNRNIKNVTHLIITNYLKEGK